MRGKSFSHIAFTPETLVENTWSGTSDTATSLLSCGFTGDKQKQDLSCN
jgi:hypothetical protein